MNEEEAIALLSSANVRDRLNAASYLVQNPSDSALPAVIAARRTERNRWVRNRLRAIIEATAGGRSWQNGTASESLELEQTFVDDVRGTVVREVTNLLVHEINPILGRIRYQAEREVPEYEHSRTRRELDRLSSLMGTLRRLNEVSATPKLEQFDIAELLSEMADEESREDIQIELVGPAPLLVFGDRHLLALIIPNAVRNAIEATHSANLVDTEPIVINWGDTDTDSWVAVLDRGIGLPLGLDQIFAIGTTSKSKGSHLGMGLALAKHAAGSFGGKLTLKPRTGGGTAFELRWPHLVQTEDENTSS